MSSDESFPPHKPSQLQMFIGTDQPQAHKHLNVTLDRGMWVRT